MRCGVLELALIARKRSLPKLGLTSCLSMCSQARHGSARRRHLLKRGSRMNRWRSRLRLSGVERDAPKTAGMMPTLLSLFGRFSRSRWRSLHDRYFKRAAGQIVELNGVLTNRNWELHSRQVFHWRLPLQPQQLACSRRRLRLLPEYSEIFLLGEYHATQNERQWSHWGCGAEDSDLVHPEALRSCRRRRAGFRPA